MKVYLRDYNNVSTLVKEKMILDGDVTFTDEPRDADVFVLWQDVRGDMAELCAINAEHMKKPVVVIQHGRGACNDYLPPNKFHMFADKYCCWGEKEYNRLVKIGLKDKAVITGSPLVGYLKELEPHDGKNIVFCPVIVNHEEPENIEIYWALKQAEIKRSAKKLRECFTGLKNEWNAWVVNKQSATEATIPYYNFNRDWRLIAKITDVHDKKLYFGDVVHTSQNYEKHMDNVVKLLQMTDCVIGVEEGTFQLLAMAMGIPVIMVDGFKYTILGDIDYSTVDMIKTDGVRRVELSQLEKTIDEELANPDNLLEQREKVLKDELWDGVGDPVQNIIDVIKGEVKNGN